MKLLMFGRGVIATQYGWALEQAGHEVVFYVRQGRSQAYGPTVQLNLLDGRNNPKGDPVLEEWPITMTETLEEGGPYDLIIVSVNHDQLTEAVRVIGPYAGNATVLIFNNIWEVPEAITQNLPQSQVLWGFPGAGGGYSDISALDGGFMKSVFLEGEKASASPVRHGQVVHLFESAGFKVRKQKNMRDWLWGHFIMNAAMSAEAMKVGGHGNIFQSSGNLRELVLLMRELAPLVVAKGGHLDPLTKWMVRLPVGWTAALLRKTAAEGSLSGEILRRMEGAGHATPKMHYDYIEPVLQDAKRLQVPLPRMSALEPFFAVGH